MGGVVSWCSPKGRKGGRTAGADAIGGKIEKGEGRTPPWKEGKTENALRSRDERRCTECSPTWCVPESPEGDVWDRDITISNNHLKNLASALIHLVARSFYFHTWIGKRCHRYLSLREYGLLLQNKRNINLSNSGDNLWYLYRLLDFNEGRGSCCTQPHLLHKRLLLQLFLHSYRTLASHYVL